MHFLRLKWNNSSLLPYLQYKTEIGGSDIDSILLEVNKNLSVKIIEGKYCVGVPQPPEFHIAFCPHKKLLGEVTTDQCFQCNRQTSTQFMHIKSLSHQQINQLKEQPHFNYINIFGHELLKTGVSAAVKKYTRVLEQASTASIFFTECDGYIARQIEDLVSRELSIKQAVNWETKLKTIKSHIDPLTAKQKLKSIYDKVLNVIPDEFKNYIKSEPEFRYNIDDYKLNLSADVTDLYLVNSLQIGDIISGKIVGFFGQVVLLKQQDNRVFALNTKALQGYIVDIDSKEIQSTHSLASRKITLQSDINMSLF